MILLLNLLWFLQCQKMLKVLFIIEVTKILQWRDHLRVQTFKLSKVEEKGIWTYLVLESRYHFFLAKLQRTNIYNEDSHTHTHKANTTHESHLHSKHINDYKRLEPSKEIIAIKAIKWSLWNAEKYHDYNIYIRISSWKKGGHTYDSN